ncbi:hypothetical protein BGX34_006706 [Mortierella sp. NVP85]|nr:hypothetical protein BGX34_006706 [Mortierella sp. NVP85]
MSAWESDHYTVSTAAAPAPIDTTTATIVADAAVAAALFPDSLPSPASTLFTPASTPCSESDDSAMLDSLSPPSSPWFPSSLDLGKEGHKNLVSGPDNAHGFSNLVSRKEDNDLDFFNNSFYQSLPDVHHPSRSSHHGRSTSIIRSRKANRSATEASRTAAPSELFNVAIDEILSSRPLNLGNLISGAIPDSGAHCQPQSLDVSSLVSELASHSQASISSEETVTGAVEETETGDEYEEGLDVDMSDDQEFFPRKADKASKTRSRPNKLKAPRVRKYSPKRTPKVYPPRKSKTLPLPQQEENEDEDEQESSAAARFTKTISTATVKACEDGGFRCELCPNERFGRVHDLKRHQISKHNEKTWPCDFCHRPFVRRDALLRHYAVKAARDDGIHPSSHETNRLSEARARAKLY